MMLISQIDGSSELAPSDLKGSTTGRQSSSVMLKHYCVGAVQAGKPFGCSEGNFLIVYESLNNAKVTK